MRENILMQTGDLVSKLAVFASVFHYMRNISDAISFLRDRNSCCQ